MFVSSHCPICADTVESVNAVVDGLRGVNLDIVCIDERPDRVPTDVVAVPTSVLDGRIIYLGNPGRNGSKRSWAQAEEGRAMGQRTVSNRSNWVPARSRVGPEEQKRRYLLTVDIFRDVGEQQIGEVERFTRMSTVAAGQLVFEPDETPEALFLLKSGKVQIHRISPEGKRFVVLNIEPGTFFGEMALVGQSMYGLVRGDA